MITKIHKGTGEFVEICNLSSHQVGLLQLTHHCGKGLIPAYDLVAADEVYD